MPEGLTAVEAAPLMCAGITTYNALRNSNARPGDVVAVLGLGGLGHLGVQYAVKMGFKTVGIARGRTRNRWRENWARITTLTARRRIGGGIAKARRRKGDSRHGDERRRDERGAGRLGCQRNAGGHRRGGVAPGFAAGVDCRTAIGEGLVFRHGDGFAGYAQVQRAGRSAVHERRFPLENVAEAYERMMSGKARFRVVLTMGQ